MRVARQNFLAGPLGQMLKKILEQKYQAEVADLSPALGDLSQVLGEFAAMPLRLTWIRLVRAGRVRP